MMYSDEYEGEDDNLGKYYSQMNLRYVLRCADLAKFNQTSFTVAPDMEHEGVKLLNYITSFYNVYASTTSMIPSYSDS